MNDGMAVIKSYFEGWVDDMKVKVDWLGRTMDDMKVEMLRMKRQIETVVRSRDNLYVM